MSKEPNEFGENDQPTKSDDVDDGKMDEAPTHDDHS